MELVELGGALPDDQPDVDWQREQARRALDEGGPDRLVELTEARLAQPDLFAGVEAGPHPERGGGGDGPPWRLGHGEGPPTADG